MKIVEPKYEILTDISEGGIKELQQIEPLPVSATRARTRSRRTASRQRSWWAFW